jgi:Ca2+-binding RTX toxin-like protein
MITRHLRIGLAAAVVIAGIGGTSSIAQMATFPPLRFCMGELATISGSGTITGTDGDDVIVGSTGADEIYGHGGNDLICAGSGNDVVYGGTGDDRLDGGLGDDTLDGWSTLPAVGPSGDDTVSYEGLTDESSSVIVNLAAAWATGYGTDRLVNIEDVIGSAGNDYIIGDGDYNYIYGGGGNDILSGDYRPRVGTPTASDDQLVGGPGDDNLEGMGGDDLLAGMEGNDQLDGGEGSDYAQFWDMHADLARGEATGEREGTDQLTAVENLWGGGVLVGDDDPNILWGSLGDDVLRGGGGSDVLDGGGGDDQLYGGPDDDTVGFAHHIAATSGVYASLAEGMATGADIGTDTLAVI